MRPQVTCLLPARVLTQLQPSSCQLQAGRAAQRRELGLPWGRGVQGGPQGAGAGRPAPRCTSAPPPKGRSPPPGSRRPSPGGGWGRAAQPSQPPSAFPSAWPTSVPSWAPEDAGSPAARPGTARGCGGSGSPRVAPSRLVPRGCCPRWAPGPRTRPASRPPPSARPRGLRPQGEADGRGGFPPLSTPVGDPRWSLGGDFRHRHP